VVDAFDEASLLADFEFSINNCFAYSLNRNLSLKVLEVQAVDIYSCSHISMELELHNVALDNSDDVSQAVEQSNNTYS
jgi:hypothetical protein